MARWGTKGAWTKDSSGGITASWSFDLEDAFRSAAQTFPGQVAQHIEAEVDGLKEAAKAKWPEWKGVRMVGGKFRIPSRRLLFAALEARATQISGYVVSPAPYTFYIKSKQNGLDPTKSVWQELVRKPAKEAALRLGRKIVGSQRIFVDGRGV